MQFSRHFHLVGGSSVEDHGKFVFADYVGGLPFHDDKAFVPRITQLVRERHIDAIFPAMDSVAVTLKDHEEIIGCPIIGSSAETTRICSSKRLTYKLLAGKIPLPTIYSRLGDIPAYPVFIKPCIGYGSRNVKLAHNPADARAFLDLSNRTDFLLCEYLPGPEYTIDCFSDRYGELRFIGSRLRKRISNGISVNTERSDKWQHEFADFANIINEALHPRGAWFFQMKEDRGSQPKLLEVAVRIGGSSGLFRNIGVNFALLSVFDYFGMDVSVLTNNYTIELDRALSSSYRIDINYDTVYLDFDDCLIINGKVNSQLISFLYRAIDARKKIVLITRHVGDVISELKKRRLDSLFDEIIHLQAGEKKSGYISSREAIFIDDSFAERQEVYEVARIPVFSPDMVEALG